MRAPRRIALLAAALLLSACAEKRSSEEYAPPPPPPVADRVACACEAGSPVVDPTLLAFLSKARAAHHQADLGDEAGDRAAAIRALEALVAGPKPGGASPPPEVAEVIADTRARLADLKSASGDFDAAGREIDEGLRLAAEPTHFRGHLVELRGLVEERRSAALKEKGDLKGAEAARQAAMKSFEQAIEIQDEVIARALGDAGAP